MTDGTLCSPEKVPGRRVVEHRRHDDAATKTRIQTADQRFSIVKDTEFTHQAGEATEADAYIPKRASRQVLPK